MIQPEWFGPRLKELRSEAGLSLKELAERAGITPDGIVKLESGARMPSWESVLALAEALGVTCLAFTTEPTGKIELRSRGRPAKVASENQKPHAEETTGEKKTRKRTRSDK